MTTAKERVARALYEKYADEAAAGASCLSRWENESLDTRAAFLADAGLVLSALAEPDEGMIEDGSRRLARLHYSENRSLPMDSPEVAALVETRWRQWETETRAAYVAMIAKAREG